MNTHVSNCNKVPRFVGRLHSTISPASTQPSITSNALSIARSTHSLTNHITDIIPCDLRDCIDREFALAMHKTATPFIFFEDPAWFAFFNLLRPAWKPPHPSKLGGQLLDAAYASTMDRTFDAIRSARGGVIGIDGATNVLSKSMSNVIIHTPTPLFIEYLKSDMHRETTANVAAKVKDVLQRIDEKLGFKCCDAFISDSCNGMRDLRKRLVEDKVVR